MTARFATLAGLIATLLAACSHEPARAGSRARARSPPLRVMTYNVNFGIPGDGPTLAAIELGKADVVFLQEINTAWERALRARFAGAYPHMAFYPRGGAGGIGIMSRLPFRGQQLIAPEGDGWFPALRLVLDSPLGPVQVLVVHLRPPVSDGGSFVAGHFTAPAIHEKEIARFVQALDHALADDGRRRLQRRGGRTRRRLSRARRVAHEDRAARIRARASDLALADQLAHLRAPPRPHRLRLPPGTAQRRGHRRRAAPITSRSSACSCSRPRRGPGFAARRRRTRRRRR